jgi:trehalose 6-phosphate phosphatase
VQASHSDAGTELRPLTGFHKGEAAEMLIQRQADGFALPVYFGDHETDEDAFRSLHRGITVKVGPGETSARYRVADADEVLEFMNRIDRLRL